MPHKLSLDEARRVFGREAKKLSDAEKAMKEERHIEGPPTHAVDPTPEGQKHDHLAEREADAEDRQEALIDEALEETFPSSDPISPKHIT
jgi:hypothetical protein